MGRLAWQSVSIIVSKLRYEKQVGPVILLIVGVHAEVSFNRLIGLLSLAISFWMKGCGIVELDVQQLTQG
jgi:hypothetical protein